MNSNYAHHPQAPSGPDLAAHSDDGWVVTLVHGTFASEAPWTQDGSTFRSMLVDQTRTSGIDVALDRFGWSGVNSHPARLEAGERLAAHISQLSSQQPQKKLCLVGHSHGGNVIGYALRDEEVRKKVGGVVTLGTPFISARPREVAPVITALCASAALLSTFLCLAALDPYFAASAPLTTQSLGDLTFADWLAIAGLVLAFLIVFAFSIRVVAPKLIELAHRSQARTASMLAVPTHAEPPCWSLYAEGDEAAVWLRVLSLISDLGHMAFWLLLAIGGAMLFLFYPLAFLSMGSGWISDPIVSVSTAFGFDFFLLLFILGAFGLLTLPITALLPLLVRSHSLGFGREALADNLFSRVRTNIFPAWCKQPFLIKVTMEKLTKRSLRHSYFYEMPLVADVVAHFLEHRGKSLPSDLPVFRLGAAPKLSRLRVLLVPAVALMALIAYRFPHYSTLSRLHLPLQEIGESQPDLVGKDVLDRRLQIPASIPNITAQRIAFDVPADAAYCLAEIDLAAKTNSLIFVSIGATETDQTKDRIRLKVPLNLFAGRRVRVRIPVSESGPHTLNISAAYFSVIDVLKNFGPNTEIEGGGRLRCWSTVPRA